MARMFLVSSLFGALVAGCVLAPIDLTGRPCPCAPGWVCTGTVCMREGAGPDAGGSDAGSVPTDGGRPVDGGSSVDSGAREDAALPVDAGIDAFVFPDAGPPDPTHCDDVYAGAIFCDGFEFPYVEGGGNWGWELTDMGTLATVSVPTPQIGARALEVTIGPTLPPSPPPPVRRAATGENFSPGILDGELWLRAWYYLPSALVIDSISVLWTGTLTGSEGISLQLYDGGSLSSWVGTISEWRGTTVTVPRDEWACLMLHIVIDETAGVVELYLNDVRAGNFTGIDTRPLTTSGGYAGVESGIEYSVATQPGGTMYVDEVVLSRTRPACD